MLTKRHLRLWPLALLLGSVGLAGCARNQELEQVYCYRTLADVSCYGEQDIGHDAQLVGTYLRDPISREQADAAASGPEEPEA